MFSARYFSCQTLRIRQALKGGDQHSLGFLREALWRRHPTPLRGDDIDTRLAQSRHVRQACEPLGARGSQDPGFLRLYLRQPLARICRGDIDVTPEQVRHHLTAALKSNKVELNSGRFLHEVSDDGVDARRA